MSKGVIVSHVGEGKYIVELQFSKERIDQEVVELTERINELATMIPEKKLEQLAAKNLVDAKVAQIDSLIPDYQGGDEEAYGQITALQSELMSLQGDVRKIEIVLAELISENLAKLKRRNQLNAIPASKTVEVWCADFTEDLSGEVGVIDINDEGGQGLVIQPGYEEEAVFSPVRDGGLFPDLAQSPYQLFFNIAVLPGVQKYFPRYRVGTITEIENDACNVLLDDAESSAQNLPINQSATLKEVPIKYMECDGDAFEKGDKVVVRFTKNGPLVIGFESEPKQCGLPIYVMSDSAIAKFSPDMSEIEEYPVSGSFDSFAVSDENFVTFKNFADETVDPESEVNTNSSSRIRFLRSGVEIETVHVNDAISPELRSGIGANSSRVFTYRSVGDGESNTKSYEEYDFDGSYIGAYPIPGAGVDITVDDRRIAVNDDQIVAPFQVDVPGEEGTDVAALRYDLLTQSIVSQHNYFSKGFPRAFVTKNRYYVRNSAASTLGPVDSFDIYSADGQLVGNWQSQNIVFYTQFCVVTKGYGYIFAYDSSPLLNVVEVFSRSGDQFEYIKTVDLWAEYGFASAFCAMPDMAKLLKLDA